MVESVQSGYKQDKTAVVISDLPTLGIDKYSALSDVILNDTNKNLFIDVVLTLGDFAVDPTVDLNAALYLIPIVDGVTDPYWNGSQTVNDDVNETYFVGSIPFNAVSTGDDYVKRAIMLPPGRFKLAVRNNCDQPFVGAALGYRPYQFASQ